MSVIDLAAKRRDRTARVEGRARCMLCGFRWKQVSPSGTVWFDCPRCEARKGYFIFPCAVEGGEVIWECECGNRLFELTPDGALCPNCGIWQGWNR